MSFTLFDTIQLEKDACGRYKENRNVNNINLFMTFADVHQQERACSHYKNTDKNRKCSLHKGGGYTLSCTREGMHLFLLAQESLVQEVPPLTAQLIIGG